MDFSVKRFFDETNTLIGLTQVHTSVGITAWYRLQREDALPKHAGALNLVAIGFKNGQMYAN